MSDPALKPHLVRWRDRFTGSAADRPNVLAGAGMESGLLVESGRKSSLRAQEQVRSPAFGSGPNVTQRDSIRQSGTLMNKDDDLQNRKVPFGDEMIARLYAEHQLRLKLWFARLCPRQKDKEDLVQETFLRLAKRLRDPDQEAIQEPAGLLYTIASRVLVDEIRRGGASKPALEPLDGTIQFPDPSPPLEESLYREESIRQTLATLPLEQRRVIQLQLSGLQPAEIARQLGVRISTIRRLLWAAYGRIRRRQQRAIRLGRDESQK